MSNQEKVLIVGTEEATQDIAHSLTGLSFDVTRLDSASNAGDLNQYILILSSEEIANAENTPVVAPGDTLSQTLAALRAAYLEHAPLHIAAFSGSAREGSFNQRTVEVAAKAAEQAGASITLVNLGDYEMPIYHGDEESAHGLPQGAREFQGLLFRSHGILVSSPEYNGFMTPLLLNALSWASRNTGGFPGMMLFNDLVVGLMAASPGGLGGMRGLVPLRSLFSNFKSLIVPQQATVGSAYKVFGGDEAPLEAVKEVGRAVVRVARSTRK